MHQSSSLWVEKVAVQLEKAGKLKNIHSTVDNQEQNSSLAKPVINKMGLLQLHTHCWFPQSAPTQSTKCLGLCVGKQEGVRA